MRCFTSFFHKSLKSDVHFTLQEAVVLRIIQTQGQCLRLICLLKFYYLDASLLHVSTGFEPLIESFWGGGDNSLTFLACHVYA